MKTLIKTLSLGVMLWASVCAKAAIVTVDPGETWLGYMNVYDLPTNGGAFKFGSPWGPADLRASFSGSVLALSPNTIGDPAEYWYVGGGAPGNPGNKEMHASMYVEKTGPLSGQTVTFTGEVLSNTLVAPYTSLAFIKDFAPDYSTFTLVSVPLENGVFSISLQTDPGLGRHVQFGFETIGPNVWVTDAPGKGSVQVVGVPEPNGLALAGLGSALFVICRRKR